MTVLQITRREPPVFPLDVFSAEWEKWIIDAAKAAASPVDYVVLPLMASASALIGNARWAQATPGWREPPHLWLGVVGDSGSSKSPGADCLLRDVLPIIEHRMLGHFPERMAEWRAAAEAHKAKNEAWEKDVRAAQKSGSPPPAPPTDTIPPEPQAPRLRQNDVTIEKVASLLAGAAPKGLLMARDELVGFLLGTTSYNDAGRAFWLEAYGGRPYRVERQKSPEPIIVQHLAVALIGGTQPEKLAEMFREADDGLLARIAWAWPNPVPFQISRNAPDVEFAIAALDKLRLLELTPAMRETPAAPFFVPLADSAVPMLEKFANTMLTEQQGTGGLLRSAYGKARGLTLRLSLTLEMLDWAGRDGVAPPPDTISEAALANACGLVANYFMPMSARVYGDAATPAGERNAATLAKWIMREKPSEVHVRRVQREVRLPGLNTADAIHAAAGLLIEAGWLGPLPSQKGFQIRPKAAYPINPVLRGGTA